MPWGRGPQRHAEPDAGIGDERRGQVDSGHLGSSGDALDNVKGAIIRVAPHAAAR
jgi:hypothetical protein